MLPFALVVGCAGVDGGDPAPPQSPPPGIAPAPQVHVSPVPPSAVPVPAAPPGAARPNGHGEVPEQLVAAMRRDLRERLAPEGGGAEAVLQVAEAVTWPDGSLGCPRPGAMYTMALVPGYRVVLRSGDREYAYHASKSGHFVYCPSSQPPAAGGVVTR